MRSLFTSLTAASILVLAVGAVPSAFPSGAHAASSPADERDILAQCETSLDGGPKLITNVAPISIPKRLTTPRDVRAEIERRAADTMRKVGMSNQQHAGCGFVDPSMPWMDGNNPEEELVRFHHILEGQGYKSVQVNRLDEASNDKPAEAAGANGSSQREITGLCWNMGRQANQYWVARMAVSTELGPRNPNDVYDKELERLIELAKAKLSKDYGLNSTSNDTVICDFALGEKFYSDGVSNNYDEEYISSRFSQLSTQHEDNWRDYGPLRKVIQVGNVDESSLSKRQKKRVFFRSPHDDGRGYTGVDFDIEYQFLVCSGELHIAYSLIQDSVRVGDWSPGSGATAHYTYKGHFYQVESVPTHVENVPLKGKVWFDYESQNPLGTFGDDFAGPALGFGCFSGQTKKIADMKELAGRLGDHPDQEAIAKLLDKLNVSFETNEILTSEAAEEEIRNGIAKQAAHNDEHIGTGAGDEVVRELEGNKAAEERAARRAAEDAEFQAKQKAYEEGMAAHQAAVEQYQKALADNEAQKAANVAAAKAQQEEFACKQAEYEAELARAKQAQDEYEAKYGKPQ